MDSITELIMCLIKLAENSPLAVAEFLDIVKQHSVFHIVPSMSDIYTYRNHCGAYIIDVFSLGKVYAGSSLELCTRLKFFFSEYAMTTKGLGNLIPTLAALNFDVTKYSVMIIALCGPLMRRWVEDLTMFNLLKMKMLELTNQVHSIVSLGYASIESIRAVQDIISRINDSIIVYGSEAAKQISFAKGENQHYANYGEPVISFNTITLQIALYVNQSVCSSITGISTYRINKYGDASKLVDEYRFLVFDTQRITDLQRSGVDMIKLVRELDNRLYPNFIADRTSDKFPYLS